MRKKVLLLLMILAMIAVTACSKKSEEKTEEIPEKNEFEEPEQLNYHPFTGIETEEDVSDRAVAVMINNHPSARPHLGLAQADIVFELLSEGNITRFLALFQSEQPEVVGSVRSARQYYFELAQGYDAIYVYHGAANFVNDMIKSSGVDYLNGALHDNDGHLFKRESFRNAPHNSFLLFNSVYEEAEKKEYEIEKTYEPLKFIEEDDMIDGEDVDHFHIDYAANGSEAVSYDYDTSLETYKRKHNNDETVELHSEDPVEIANVFVIETVHEIIDNEGRRQIDIESGGNAFLFQRGKMQRVEWENDNGHIVPIKDGETIGFVPGKTWINFVPTNPGIEQSITFESD